MSRRRRFLPALLPVCLLMLAGCPTIPDGDIDQGPELPPVSPDRGALPYAVAAADAVGDPFSQAFVYTSIAEAYIESGLPEQAALVLRRAFSRVSALPNQPGRTEVLVELATGYFRADRADMAVPILENALAAAQGIDDDFSRGLLIQGIIEAAFLGGDAAADVLRDAVLSVYVIQDLWTRVSILVDVARRYQESGLGRGVSNLLQQALPAATGLENPWQKAAAFSEIAGRYAGAGERDQALQQARRAVREINSVTVVTRTEEDARHLLTVGNNLVALGLFDEAVSVVQTIEFPYLRAGGLAEIGRRQIEADLLSSGNLLLAAATNLLVREPSLYRRALGQADLSVDYLEVGNRQLALVNATSALELASQIEDQYERSEVLTQVARVYIRIGDTPTAVSVMGGIEDGYIRSSSLASIAQSLTSEVEYHNIAPTLYEAGLRSADQAEYLQDGLYATIAEGFASAAAPARAVEAATRIRDLYSLSVALAGIGRYVPPGTAIEAFRRLEEALSSAWPEVYGS